MEITPAREKNIFQVVVQMRDLQAAFASKAACPCLEIAQKIPQWHSLADALGHTARRAWTNKSKLFSAIEYEQILTAAAGCRRVAKIQRKFSSKQSQLLFLFYYLSTYLLFY